MSEAKLLSSKPEKFASEGADVFPLKQVFGKVKEVLSKSARFKDAKFFIAGGAVRRAAFGEEPADYDFFFEDIDVLNYVTSNISSVGGVFVRQSNYSETYLLDTPIINMATSRVQFIAGETGTMEKVLGNFDIVAAQWAFDGELIYYTQEAYQDSFEKLINYNNIKFPGTVLNHTIRYVSNGFHIELHAIRTLLDAIREAPKEELFSTYE